MRCLIVRGETAVLRFPLPVEDVRLGSDPANDLVVSMPGVSRFHARVVPDSVAPRLFDLGSKNGLIVQGRRLREVALLPGVTVQAGTAQITLDDGPTSDLELAMEFSTVKREDRPSNDGEAAVTETVGSVAGSPDALSLLRDLEKYGRPGRRDLEPGELLDRLCRTLGARSIALVRSTSSGPHVIETAGERLRDDLLARLPVEAVGDEPIRFVDLGGLRAAYRSPGRDGGNAAVVVLPAGSDFAPWQRELLAINLEYFTDARNEVARRLAKRTASPSGLVLPPEMVFGSSPPMRALRSRLALAARSKMDVLVLGETGTGKELVARAIHASGQTASGPFVAINCAALPADLLEAELFGVRARVATGVDARPGRVLEAGGGTLILDEIGELPLALQAKLLRLLQEREVHAVGAAKPEKVNVRVISISNRDLAADVKDGRFRGDLYHRIRGLECSLPPLRERREDIPELARAFTARAAAEESRSIRGMTRKALGALVAHDWPGNVRELLVEIRKAVVLCPDGGTLTCEQFQHLSGPSDVRVARQTAASPGGAELNLRRRVEALERETIREALDRAAGNRSRAATLLGLTRAGLRMKLRRLLGER